MNMEPVFEPKKLVRKKVSNVHDYPLSNGTADLLRAQGILFLGDLETCAEEVQVIRVASDRVKITDSPDYRDLVQQLGEEEVRKLCEIIRVKTVVFLEPRKSIKDDVS